MRFPHTVPFVTLYSLCCDSERALTRWPLFSEMPPDELPWDMVRVIENRKFREAVQQRVQMERDYPAPTPRTRASASGFSAWSKFVEAEQKQRYEEGYQPPHERMPHIVPGAELAFDHKLWAKWGELIYYHQEHRRAYRLSEIPQAQQAGSRAKQPKVQAEDYGVFG